MHFIDVWPNRSLVIIISCLPMWVVAQGFVASFISLNLFSWLVVWHLISYSSFMFSFAGSLRSCIWIVIWVIISFIDLFNFKLMFCNASQVYQQNYIYYFDSGHIKILSHKDYQRKMSGKLLTRVTEHVVWFLINSSLSALSESINKVVTKYK